MAPKISFTKTTLSYPLYAADFDPYNRGRLVVGGGGGEGRSGVGNKITVLDVSSRESIETIAEIELSRDEDSVTSLANLAQQSGLITFAGVNSSEALQQAGKNEHFRAFQVRYPAATGGATGKSPKKKQKGGVAGSITPISKTALFQPSSGPKKEAYQRVLRLSQMTKLVPGHKKIGAVATGLGKPNEVVVFNATTTAPSAFDVIQRVELENGSEAADVDIFEAEDQPGSFTVAYCTDDTVFVSKFKYDFAKKKVVGSLQNPSQVHSIPPQTSRRKLRSLRFLGPDLILLLVNLPNRTGVELQLLEGLDTNGVPGTVILRKMLQRDVKQAVGMDVSLLDPDTKTNERQAVVAVAGQDISITVLTLDLPGRQGGFKTITVLKDVHPLQMTKVLLSPFPYPVDTGAQSSGRAKHYLRLASVSMGNTVVVESLPLQPINSKPLARHVLSLQSGLFSFLDGSPTLIVVAATLLITLFLFQNIVKLDPNILPSSLRPYFASSYNESAPVSDTIPPVLKQPINPAIDRIRDLLHTHHSDLQEDKKAIVVRTSELDSGIETEVHHDSEDAVKEDIEARKWEELSKHEQARWKERLIKAGHWAVDEGEIVLKGVLFSEYAGAVGRMAAEAIAGG